MIFCFNCSAYGLNWLMQLDTTKNESGSLLTLTLDQRVDAFNSPPIEASVAEFISQGGRRVVFDCSRVSYVSSAGLRTFLATVKKLQAVGGSCAFAALSPTVQQAFRISGFAELLEIHETVAAARAAQPKASVRLAKASSGHSPSQTLTFTEEIALLALDDQTGNWLELPPDALNYGFAGAIIADLCFAGRVDTDAKALTVINPKPTGNELLDTWLQKISQFPKTLSVAGWLEELALDGDKLREAAIQRLIGRGILRLEEKRVLWVFASRRYPTLDGHERMEVRSRMRQLILGDDLPDPWDATLIGLLCGCTLQEQLFAGPEFADRGERLKKLSKLDPLGRDVNWATNTAVEVLVRSLSSAMPPI
jgi:golgi phosphoprotein 3